MTPRAQRRHRLWVRLLGSHVLLVVVTSVAIGLLILELGQGAIRQSIQQQHQLLAQQLAQEIQRLVSLPLSGLEGLTLALRVERAAWQRQTLLSRATQQWGVIDELLLVDSSGTITASSVLDQGSPLQAGQRLPADYLPADRLPLVLNGTSGRSFAAAEVRHGRPVAFVELEVEEGGAVSQTLIAQFNLYEVWQLVDRLDIGDRGRALVVDPQGSYVAHPSREEVYRQARYPRLGDLEGGTLGTFEWSDTTGGTWLTAYAAVAPLGWVVVLEQPANIAYAQVGRLQRRGLAVLMVGLGAAILLGVAILRSITRPVALLLQQVRGLPEGTTALGVLPPRGDELGELGEVFAAMGRSLTDRQAALQASLAFAQSVVQSAPVGIGVLDTGHRVIQANPLWNTLLLDAGRPGHLLVDGPRGVQVRGWLDTCPRPGDAAVLEVRDEDGRLLYWSIRLVRLPEGQPGSLLLVLEDQTQQRALEMQLTRTAKLASLGEMSAGVAHEIKNPLAIIQSASDLLRRLAPEERQTQVDTLVTLEAAVRRIGGRIDDLLDFARPTHQAQEAVDVVALLRQLIRLQRQILEHARIAIIEEFCGAPLAYIHRDVLKEVLLNLVRNAVDAMPTGGQLRLGAAEESGETVLRVADTGSGIAADRLARVFDPFYTTKPKGLGMGLAIAHREVRQVGGRIEVQSEMGKGTVFTVYLPPPPREGA